MSLTHITPEIKNLRLVKAMKGFAADLLSCIEVRDASEVYVVDDDEAHYSRFATENDDLSKCFCGQNPRCRNLHLLAIDNKLVSGLTGGIADCALFHSDTFALIEFKTNAEGSTPESIRYTYDKAISQIKNTVGILSERLASVKIDFLDYIEVCAHVVVAQKFPRHSAMEQNYAAQFANDMFIELYFDNSREF